MTLQLGTGQSFTHTQNSIQPDGPGDGQLTLGNFTTMSSGDYLTQWTVIAGNGMNVEANLITGVTTISGPGTITFTREKLNDLD